jgi:site-specific DNA-methyltransferase (adenine-specific)
MKIDIVVGNPPYNKDIYLDFVENGHKIAGEYSIFITPAKWQAKGGDKNEQFRREIVPHMSKIVYYKDSTDIFDIKEWGGISYFITDKDIHNDKLVKNICINKALDSDYETHDENNVTLVPKHILNILNKINNSILLDFTQSYYVSNTEHGHNKSLNSAIEVMSGNQVTGYVSKQELKTLKNLDKYKCITGHMIGAVPKFGADNRVLGIPKFAYIKPNQVHNGSFIAIKYFDTEQCAQSFISFLETKLVAFLFYIGICGTSMSQEMWRFVPDPGAFDHIFTDQELYAKYNLTADEINIIESVIKERK